MKFLVSKLNASIYTWSHHINYEKTNCDPPPKIVLTITNGYVI